MKKYVIINFLGGANFDPYSDRFRKKAEIAYNELTANEVNFFETLPFDLHEKTTFLNLVPKTTIEGMIYRLSGETSRVKDIKKNKNIDLFYVNAVSKAAEAAKISIDGQLYKNLFRRKYISPIVQASVPQGSLVIKDLIKCNAVFEAEIKEVIGSTALSSVMEALLLAADDMDQNSQEALNLFTEVLVAFNELPETNFGSEIVRKTEIAITKNRNSTMTKKADYRISKLMKDLLLKIANRIKKDINNEEFRACLNTKANNFLPLGNQSTKTIIRPDSKNRFLSDGPGPGSLIVTPIRIAIPVSGLLADRIEENGLGVTLGESWGSITINEEMPDGNWHDRLVVSETFERYILADLSKVSDYSNYQELVYSVSGDVNSGALHAFISSEECLGKNLNGSSRKYSAYFNEDKKEFIVRSSSGSDIAWPSYVKTVTTKGKGKSVVGGLENTIELKQNLNSKLSVENGDSVTFSADMVLKLKKKVKAKFIEVKWTELDAEEQVTVLTRFAKAVGLTDLKVSKLEEIIEVSAKESHTDVVSLKASGIVSSRNKFLKFYVLGYGGKASYGRGSVSSIEISKADPTSKAS